MKNGFTLIELLIVIAVIGVITSVAAAFFKANSNRNSDGSVCKYGMKYDRANHQIIGPNGGGVPCEGTNKQ